MPTGKDWVNKTFSISKEDVDTVLADIQTIAKREKRSRSSIIVEALEEYRNKHLPGNFQTLLESYRPDGARSEAQIEKEICRVLQEKAKVRGNELSFKEIIAFLKEAGYTDAQKRLEAANRITSKLVEERFKIWR